VNTVPEKPNTSSSRLKENNPLPVPENVNTVPEKPNTQKLLRKLKTCSTARTGKI
jgi:hypothetical protein